MTCGWWTPGHVTARLVSDWLNCSSVRLLSDLGAWQLMTRAPAAGGVAPGPAGEVRTMRVWDGCSGAGIHFSCDEDR